MFRFILFYVLTIFYFNCYSQIKFGYPIAINYSTGGGRYEKSCVCYGWYKVVNTNKTRFCVGKDINNILATRLAIEFNREYEIETYYDKSEFIYDFSDSDSLQFIIKDGDTINYYDTLGRRQGWFINSRNIIDDRLSNDKEKRCIKKCSYCKEFLEYEKFNNDILCQRYILGISKDNIIDTIEHYYYINDSIFCGKTRENDEFYNVKYYIGRNMIEYKLLNDTVWSHYITGELYSKYEQSIFSTLGLVKTFWKNGNIKFIKNFDYGTLNGILTYYRENNTKQKEFYYLNGKIIKSKCYDLVGKNEIECKNP